MVPSGGDWPTLASWNQQLEVRKVTDCGLSGCLAVCNFTMLLLSDKNVENAGGNNG